MNYFICSPTHLFLLLHSSSRESQMQVSMYKLTRKLPMLLLLLHFSIFIAQSSSFPTKIENVLVPSTKCEECPGVNPCSQQPPTPPPPPPPPSQYTSPPPPRFVYVTGATPLPPPPQPIQYISPPPPRFVYVTGVAPPPPPRFFYTTGTPGNLYGSDPFEWQMYSNAPHISLQITTFLLVLVFSALQLLVVFGD